VASSASRNRTRVDGRRRGTDGMEALRLVEHQPDILIIDIGMPR
jgi:DNA-binding NarL/FixJ family response regulator